MSGPKFKRKDATKYKRLSSKRKSYRRPTGSQSKVRKNQHGNLVCARVGFGTDSESRGKHPSGLEDVLVMTLAQLEYLSPEKHIVRLSSGVGMRKKEILTKAAQEKSLRVICAPRILRKAAKADAARKSRVKPKSRPKSKIDAEKVTAATTATEKTANKKKEVE